MIKTALLLASVLALRAALAQTPAPAPTPPPSSDLNARVQNIVRAATSAEPLLTKFSLNFPGGTPKQLIAAIEKAMAKPLNAIIPPEHADTMLPPLTMNNVDVQQLFRALELTSQKTEAYVTSRQPTSYQQMRTSYGFRTQGDLSDASIWYFYVDKPALPFGQSYTPPKICRYFSLSPYLDRGQTVDDITTAIQTGWKMLGEDDIPKISFHKETKLLIAVGDAAKLETIDAVLQALKTSSPKLIPIEPATGLPSTPSPSPKTN